MIYNTIYIHLWFNMWNEQLLQLMNRTSFEMRTATRMYNKNAMSEEKVVIFFIGFSMWCHKSNVVRASKVNRIKWQWKGTDNSQPHYNERMCVMVFHLFSLLVHVNCPQMPQSNSLRVFGQCCLNRTRMEKNEEQWKQHEDHVTVQLFVINDKMWPDGETVAISCVSSCGRSVRVCMECVFACCTRSERIKSCGVIPED